MTKTKEEIFEEIAALQERIKTLEEGDDTTSYDESLDDCYTFDEVGGPFKGMSPARVLSEVDPTAYRCGLNDYNDAELNDLNGELDDLKSELEGLDEPEEVTE